MAIQGGDQAGDAGAPPPSAAWVTPLSWVALVLAGLLIVVAGRLPDPGDDLVRITGLVLAAAIGTLGVVRNRPPVAMPWRILALSLWLGALDQALWRVWSDDLVHAADPSIALPGIVGTLGFATTFVALLALATTGQRTLRRKALLVDTAIVAIAAGFVAFELVDGFVTEPVNPRPMWAGVVFVVLAIAVVFAATPIVRSRVGRPSAFFVGTSAVCVLLATVAFTVAHGDGNRDAPWPLLLGLGVVAGAAGMLHPSMRRIGTDVRRVESPLDARQLAVGGLALLIPAAIIGVADLVSTETIGSSAAIAAYLVAMAVLIRARTRLLVQEGRRSDERFRQYFSLPLIGMLISAPDGRAVDVNDRLCQILGSDRDDLVGHRTGDLVHPDDLARNYDELLRLSRGEISSVVSERRYVRPDGSEVYARCTDHVVTDEDGNVEYILSLIDDITEAHEAERRMEAHLALQDVVLQVAERFVNIEAHDVDGELDRALSELGHHCDADTAILVERRDDRVHLTHRWWSDDRLVGEATAAGIETVFDSMGLMERLASNGAVVIDSVEEVEALVPPGAELMRERSVSGFVMVPLMAEDVMLGAICLTRNRSGLRWSQDMVELLRLAAEVFAQALIGRRTASALAESEARNRSVVEAAADGIVTVDHRGNIRTFNPAAEILTGWMAAEVVGRPAELLVPDAGRRAIREFRRVGRGTGAGSGSGSGTGSEKIEIDGLRRDGTRFPLELTVSPVDLPDGRGMTVIARDVSDRKRLEAQLTHQALHDPLTGLANRTLLLDRMGTALRRAQRTGAYPVVLFIDLDRFKVINDSLGHHVGDELLVVVARRLEAELRAGDTAARLGGDEFVALCEGIGDTEQAEALAERILAAVSLPVDLDRATPVVTASIGIVRAGPGATPETLLRDADASMYRAKEHGRNRTHHFDESVHGAAIERLQLEAGLRQALTGGELRLYLQPQYAVDDLHPIGAEALLRWERPGEGILSPDRFLAVAEEIGLDVEIDRWVLLEGCRHARRCVERNPAFVVWVNLSARLLADPVLPGLVFDALAATGLPATNLGIEVTERALVRDLDVAATSLDELRTAGVAIAIDDFGTGFSSLSWLERLPLDVLKIDRSFIDGLGASHDDTVIVRSVIAMAHSLGLAALAEGVETVEQLSRLRELGCDEFQGFLAARPVPVDQVAPEQPARLVAGTSR
jgi:diguanylate cyclase (GGDEF)-like protein/PAS domain S-box-containing protein